MLEADTIKQTEIEKNNKKKRKKEPLKNEKLAYSAAEI